MRFTAVIRLVGLGLATTLAAAAAVPRAPISAERVGDRPIITEDMFPGEEGASINGPSLIRVPSWVQQPLGKYYLYFAHHAGKSLRLAYADRVEGPWKLYAPGVLPLSEQTAVLNHVASPDAVIEEASHQIYLFYHGWSPDRASLKKTSDDPDPEGSQVTAVSVSADGVHFRALNRIVGPSYLRVFRHGGRWFGLNYSGVLLAAASIDAPFQPVARIIGNDVLDAVDPARRGEPGAMPAENRPKTGPFRYAIRHIATDVSDDRLTVYFSCTGHRPERILATVIWLKGPPETWRARGTWEVLQPGTAAEGASLPLAYSRGGISLTRVRELRDPGVFRDGGDAWLVYSVSGEHGLGLARLRYDWAAEAIR